MILLKKMMILFVANFLPAAAFSKVFDQNVSPLFGTTAL
jgi:hypothetical protein